jgi:large subunit ribosomal protein L7/L12
VIAYQMLTGHLHQGAGPDFADDLRDAGAPDELIALLGRCVAQKADRRPKDAGELRDALQTPASPPPPVPSAPPTAAWFQVELLPGSEVRQKVALIKEVRRFTGFGLAEAKRFVETLPQPVGRYPDRAAADVVAAQLAAVDGITRVVPVEGPVAQPGDAGGFQVTLLGFDPQAKIAILRAVRELTGWGLAEAKAFAEAAPRPLPPSPDLAAAEAAAAHLTRAGARVSVGPVGVPPAPNAPLQMTMQTVLNPARESHERAVQTVFGCGSLVGFAMLVLGLLATAAGKSWLGLPVALVGLVLCTILFRSLPVRR